MTRPPQVRLTADERREDVLAAAVAEFAAHGIRGGSTAEIARQAGISHGYLFQLFGSKHNLFKTVVARCFRQTLAVFQSAAEGRRGPQALAAMGHAYGVSLLADRTLLNAHLQAYAACDDAEIREVVKNGFGDWLAYAEHVTGLPREQLSSFFANGMLVNVLAAMFPIDVDEEWAEQLLAACRRAGREQENQ